MATEEAIVKPVKIIVEVYWESELKDRCLLFKSVFYVAVTCILRENRYKLYTLLY